MSFSPETAAAAVEAGWTRAEILLVDNAVPFPKVTRVLPWAAVLGNRWFAYRRPDLFLPDLHLALALPANREPTDPEYHPYMTIAYADGSGTTGEKKSGCGVLVVEPLRPPRSYAEDCGPGTNNHAELAAVWRALRAVPDARRKLRIRTDSEYAAGMCRDRGNAARANAALVEAIRADVELRRKMGGKVEFEHVDGHAGNPGNECADSLARIGRLFVDRALPLPL